MKTAESERQNFDPEKIIERITLLMEKFPISMVVFFPAIGGTQCYVLIKKSAITPLIVYKAHEDVRYQHLIGQFKKPDNGMLLGIKDILYQEFSLMITSDISLFIGNSMQDEQAAVASDIPFLHAAVIHAGALSHKGS